MKRPLDAPAPGQLKKKKAPSSSQLLAAAAPPTSSRPHAGGDDDDFDAIPEAPPPPTKKAKKSKSDTAATADTSLRHSTREGTALLRRMGDALKLVKLAGAGLEVYVSPLGATLVRVLTPDKAGTLAGASQCRKTE